MTGSTRDNKNMESPPNQSTSGDSKGRPGSRVLPRATDTPTSGRSLDRQNSTPKGVMNYGPFFLEYSLLAEYNQLQKQQLPGVYVMPSANSVLLWHGVLFLRQGLYQEGIFRFSLLIPDNYPEGDCPRLVFDPPVFHPLVDPDSGELDVKRAFTKWRKNVHHIWQVLLYARRVFYKIDTKNALNQKAAKLYEQDPEMFKKKVSDNVVLCKDKIYEPPSSSDPYALRFSHWDPAVHAEQKNKMLSPKSKEIEKSRIDGFTWMLGNRIFEKDKLDL